MEGGCIGWWDGVEVGAVDGLGWMGRAGGCGGEVEMVDGVR